MLVNQSFITLFIRQGFDIGFAKLSERRNIFERCRIWGDHTVKAESAAGASILNHYDIIARSALSFRTLRINFVRLFVCPSVCPPRIIITFCEGDMDPVTHHWSTGSLKLGFGRFQKMNRLNFDQLMVPASFGPQFWTTFLHFFEKSWKKSELAR